MASTRENMNEWLAEELNELQKRKHVQATKDDRQDSLEKQAEVLWNTLKSMLDDALEKLNSTIEFREHTGKLRLTVSNPQAIVIRRTGVFPKGGIARRSRCALRNMEISRCWRIFSRRHLTSRS